MAQQRDYYEILGVKREATADEIRSAYRRLARRYHPDVNKDADAARRFAEISEAYDVLSDAEKRKQYDRFGRVGAGVGGAGPGPHTQWRTTTDFGGDFSADDLGSLFEQMFGGGGGRGAPFGGGRAGPFRAERAGPRPQRGPDVETALSVSFLTAALGGTEQFRAADSSGKAQSISLRIPPGIESGSKLRLKGKGRPGAAGGPPGDMIVTVEVGAHPRFRRDGLDVLVDVPITIAEAALGVSVTVPLLSGSVEIKIPPGSSGGKKLRVKGKGIKAGSRTGDFYAVVQIVAPERLSDRAETLIRDLAGELKNPRDQGPWADQ